MRKLFYTTALSTIVILLMSSGYAQTTITGCVGANKGNLYNVQEGTSPSDPCNQQDLTLSWAIQGADGVDGAPGADGADGAPGGEPRFEWVGITTDFTDGSMEISGSEMCQIDHPGSRMCTSEEVMHTVDPGPLYQAILGSGSLAAWVLPVTEGGTGVDVSGVRSNETGHLGCTFEEPANSRITRGFYTTEAGPSASVVSVGLVVQANPNEFTTFTCDSMLPVACCAPVSE